MCDTQTATATMTNNEVLDHIEAFAAAKIAEHLPPEGWTFSWLTTKRTMGLCDYRTKMVSASKIYVGIASVEQLENTVLHEIAHALAGFKAGHGFAWERACVAIGAEPKRLFDASQISPPYTWARSCPSCGPVAKYFSKPRSKRSHSCGRCSGGAFNRDFLLFVEKI